jgi:hypothetical protein
MRKLFGFAIVMAALAFTCAEAAAMSKEEYRAGKARIEAEYEADRKKCGHPRLGNATDVCVALARGNRKAASAELDAKYKPGPQANYKAAAARADAEYGVAKQRCDYQQGAARKACNQEAKAARDRAKAEAAARR